MRTVHQGFFATAIAILASGLVPLACGDDTGGSTSAASSGEPGDAGGSSALPPPPACEGPLGAGQDPSGLESCCPEHGGAHCIDSVDEKLGKLFGPCDGGGYCVADDFIATGGVFTPKSCASLGGAEGACLSKCAPKVAEKADLLPQDVCKGSEVCVPCISPIDGMSTGACEGWFTCDEEPGPSSGSGPTEPECPHVGPPVVDPSTYPACGDICGGGHCVPDASIPPESIDKFAACDEQSKCVPDSFIESAGQFIPPTCESVAGAEGRCLSTCLPDVAAKAGSLPQSSCADEHVCVPCFDPFDGEDTDACRLSCDPGPAEPAVQLPKCCSDIGTCVPNELLSSEQLDKLDEDSCDQSGGAMACVPNVFLDPSYAPTPCEPFWVSSIFGDDYAAGACVPECLPDVQGWLNDLLLDQDGCADHYVCAPCTSPLTGDPSGACDAPGGGATNSCAGNCGDQAPDGCWCDDSCVDFGDCCVDACSECGSCP